MWVPWCCAVLKHPNGSGAEPSRKSEQLAVIGLVWVEWGVVRAQGLSRSGALSEFLRLMQAEARGGSESPGVFWLS